MLNQNPNLITGQKGPYSVLNCQQNYQDNSQVLAGGRGWNAFYNWEQQAKNDPTGQLSQATFQYTNPDKPSFYDAFGVGNSAIKFLGNGQNTLDLNGVSQLTGSSLPQAMNYLAAADKSGDGKLDAKEIGALTLLEDKPANILWDIVEASKNSTTLSASDKQGITQLETQLKSVLSFDAQGNVIRQTADGQITPQDRALLDNAVRLAPGVVKEAINQLTQSLNLDKTYQDYQTALNSNQATLQSPWSSQYNGFGNNYLPYGSANGFGNQSAWQYPPPAQIGLGNGIGPSPYSVSSGNGSLPLQNQGFGYGVNSNSFGQPSGYNSGLWSLMNLLSPNTSNGVGNTQQQNSQLYVLMLLLSQMQSSTSGGLGYGNNYQQASSGFGWPNSNNGNNANVMYGNWPNNNNANWYNTPLSISG